MLASDTVAGNTHPLGMTLKPSGSGYSALISGKLSLNALLRKVEWVRIPAVNASKPDLALRSDLPGRSCTQRAGF